MQGNSKRYIPVVLSFLFVIALVLPLTLLTPRLSDDWRYQFNFACGGQILEGDELSTPIGGMADILESQYAHYFVYNGRAVAHLIMQTIEYYVSGTIICLINALMYVVFICILLGLGDIRLSRAKLVFAACLLTLICFNTVYIFACQINYVWMAVLSFGFVYVYLNKTLCHKWGALCMWFLLSIIAGNSHEAYNIGIGGALIIYNLTHFTTISKKQWVMFFGFGIGGLILCLSPGSIGRTGTFTPSLYYSMFRLLIYPRVLYIFLIIFAYAKLSRAVSVRDFCKENAFYFYIIAVTLIFNMQIGIYFNRQFFGIDIVAAVLSLKLLKKFGDKAFSTAIVAAMAVYVLVYYGYKFYFTVRVNDDIANIERLWADSPDGTIYYDPQPLPYPYFQTPCIPMDLPFPAFSTLKWTLQAKHQTLKPLFVKPTFFLDLEKGSDFNRVVEYSPGTYFCIQDKKRPADFYLERNYYFMGLSYPKADYKVDFSIDNDFNTDDYNVEIFGNSVPFVQNRNVRMEAQAQESQPN